MEDTIYAPSTAIGGAIAILRVSGEEAARVRERLSHDPAKHPRELIHALLLQNGEALDDCMAVYFPAPRSYTGEDMIELHVHGGMQTVRLVLAALRKLGFRPADAGEFTKRAFLNGKMDLSRAEAVMDVVTADAEQSLKAAMLQLQGSVQRETEDVETLLLDALSGVDAALDYPDEAETDMLTALPKSLQAARERLDAILLDARRGRVLRDGLRAAIVGRPNVGKSSLLNALLGRERAIVTATAGTTRDVLDEKLSMRGVPVRLIDTAGLREADSEAERIGVSRAREALQTADVVLVVLDASEPLTEADLAILDETAKQTRVIVKNKSDLPQNAWENAPQCTRDGVCVSARTGLGVSNVEEAIIRLAAPERSDGSYITNERHISAFEQARRSVVSAENALDCDCAATDIRDALHALGQITGRDVDADVIDRIFSRFCVGK